MGACKYGISLRVVNAIAYEWEQGKRGISGWTLEEKFHFISNHVLFCLLGKHNRPYWQWESTLLMNEKKKKKDPRPPPAQKKKSR